jgi:hypothetical protein
VIDKLSSTIITIGFICLYISMLRSSYQIRKLKKKIDDLEYDLLRLEKRVRWRL